MSPLTNPKPAPTPAASSLRLSLARLVPSCPHLPPALITPGQAPAEPPEHFTLTHLEPGRRPCPACGLTETWPLLLGSRSSRLSDQSVCYRLPGLQAFELGLELHISSPVPDSCRLRILSLHNCTNQFLVIAFRLLTLIVLLPCRSE